MVQNGRELVTELQAESTVGVQGAPYLAVSDSVWIMSYFLFVESKEELHDRLCCRCHCLRDFFIYVCFWRIKMKWQTTFIVGSYQSYSGSRKCYEVISWVTKMSTFLMQCYFILCSNRFENGNKGAL